jgi:DNA polymerase-3 subunit epsilon
MSAIDLPFLNRDLGWDFMRKYFVHRQLDLSSVSYTLIDLGLLPENCSSGSKLMEFFDMGEVAHTALEDAINTAKIYLKMLQKFSKN